jgi:hypothetical protein
VDCSHGRAGGDGVMKERFFVGFALIGFWAVTVMTLVGFFTE